MPGLNHDARTSSVGIVARSNARSYCAMTRATNAAWSPGGSSAALRAARSSRSSFISPAPSSPPAACVDGDARERLRIVRFLREFRGSRRSRRVSNPRHRTTPRRFGAVRTTHPERNGGDHPARNVRQAEPLDASLVGGGPRPDAAAVRSELGDRLRSALGELSERRRTAVVLFDVEGYSHAEIAGILGIPEGTVRSEVFHARRRLRTLLADWKEQVR